ncbi:MAG: hypothetical protein ABII22_04270 [Candidatus Micrarchaeota archaeon]
MTCLRMNGKRLSPEQKQTLTMLRVAILQNYLIRIEGPRTVDPKGWEVLPDKAKASAIKTD